MSNFLLDSGERFNVLLWRTAQVQIIEAVTICQTASMSLQQGCSACDRSSWIAVISLHRLSLPISILRMLSFCETFDKALRYKVTGLLVPVQDADEACPDEENWSCFWHSPDKDVVWILSVCYVFHAVKTLHNRHKCLYTSNSL